MLKARPEALSNEGLAQALSDPRWPRRVAALRYIHAHDIDVARYPQYTALLESPLVVERYWLTRALATSRSSATYHQLISLMRDPHPNVVCQAYYALGRRGDRRAVKPILEQMAQSGHWYAQWYGYRALRRLQWHQNRLR
jgi:HEAT repeat protein